MKFRRAPLPLFFIFLAFSACSGERSPGNSAARADDESPAVNTAPGPAWPVLALLQTGKNPLWFEFGTEGPALIESPGAASLTPYAPWPHARFSAGLEIWRGSLVMAVNRDGFLVISAGKENGAALLYRAAFPRAPYTAGPLFFHDDKPAVLLYRDDFFATPRVPMPEPQTLTLREDMPAPRGERLPALEALPKEEGWEVNSLRRGPGGAWYYRFVQTGYPRPGSAHYRAEDLSREGEKISLEEYRDSAKPEEASAGPPFVGALFAATETYLPGLKGTPVLRLLLPEPSAGTSGGNPSPGGSVSRVFAARTDAEGNAAEGITALFGQYREGGAVPEAFAVAPCGRGIAFRDGAFQSFTLPPLPEGFVYTAAALAGNVFAATWEEQEDSLIGAAGFMVLDAETITGR